MTRPTDWWVLDLGDDPTPGSPAGVRAMARRWHQVADDAAWAQRRIGQLMGEGAVGRWIGEAGDAFRERSNELPCQLGKCADSYGQAAEALSWWADRLEIHQGDADAALVRGRAARHELEQAEAAARRAAEHTVAAMGAPVHAGGSLAPSPDQVRDARARLASAQAARDQADAAVADASARLDAARRLALDAQSLRETDGRTAAERIRDAADAAIPERSRWDKLKDWAGEAWKVVVQVARVVVAVLGVVALLLGGPLAWIVLAASVVLLAEAIAKWRRGESPWWEVALAALGCIPGTRGLLTADALASASAVPLQLARGFLRTSVRGMRSPAVIHGRVFRLPSGPVHPADAHQGALLREHLRLTQKYGECGVRHLDDGRVRYYGALRPPRTRGMMQGMRKVREWSPSTNMHRTWLETIDHAGRIRQVRSDAPGVKRHHWFGEDGSYEGTW